MISPSHAVGTSTDMLPPLGTTFTPELGDTPTIPDHKDCAFRGRAGLFEIVPEGRFGSALKASSNFPQIRVEGHLQCANTKIRDLIGDDKQFPNYTIGFWMRRNGPLAGPAGEGTRFLTFLSSLPIPRPPHWLAKTGLEADSTVSQSAGNCSISQGTKNVTDNQWHHILAVFDRTHNRLRLYIDGTIDQYISCDTGFLSGSDVQFLAAAEKGDFTFNGLIDDLFVEDHAWSEE